MSIVGKKNNNNNSNNNKKITITITKVNDVNLQEKLMSIVGKKRVKPEVVLLLPRSPYY